MQIAYIIGPYRGKSIYEVKTNIERAERVAAKIMQVGHGVICPHKNTGLMDGIISDDAILRMDIEILSRCDFAVCVTGWEKSVGSIGEIRFCLANEIPVYNERMEVITLESIGGGG